MNKNNDEIDMIKDKIIFYQNEDSNVYVDILFVNENFWLTQKSMSELFEVDVTTINEHIKNIYLTGELDQESTLGKFPIVRSEGNRKVTRNLNFYNLDMTIAVGYRVNSLKATRFRQWATKTLKEYIIKGYVLNDEMLKNGKPFGQDYFDELLERIREIRASERRFYQKITDIYATSYDYNKDALETREFFATVQNKLLFAVTGKTAPEIISTRADSTKENMGLRTWSNAPDGKILKSDAKISKNYLENKEISELNRIVSMYLDYAENQAQKHKPMSMSDWRDRLNAFLQFNEYEILNNPGKISRSVADELVDIEYEKFRVIQDKNFVSDFDKEVKHLIDKRNNNA